MPELTPETITTLRADWYAADMPADHPYKTLVLNPAEAKRIATNEAAARGEAFVAPLVSFN